MYTCIHGSSDHAIHQHHVPHDFFVGGLFSNISHDHLDYLDLTNT